MSAAKHSKRHAAIVLAGLGLLAGCASGPTPVRSDALFYGVHPGMTQEEVHRLLGPPDPVIAFALSNTGEWDYQFQDTWGYFAVFSVRFDAGGRAVAKFTSRINDGGDHQ